MEDKAESYTELESVLEGQSFILPDTKQGLNGADAHILTSFTPFPEEELWQLSFYVDGQLFDKFYRHFLKLNTIRLKNRQKK